jgi:H+-transporting ATPase
LDLQIAWLLTVLFFSVALVAVIVNTTFFQDKFGVTLTNQPGEPIDHNDYQLHMIVYLQVAIISQALIFVTRSHGFFFMERPSFALLGAFCIAQLVSSIIAAYADFGFTQIQSISAGWIGIVWVWVSTHKHSIQETI